MPRYFFHLSFGQRVVSDEDGFELPNRSAACTEAWAVVRELTNPEVSGGSRRWASWFLEVADESGGFFRTPIGHPALEVVTREAPRAEPREAVWLTPRLPSDLPAKGRVADIVREMLARRQHRRTAPSQQSAPARAFIHLSRQRRRTHPRQPLGFARPGRQRPILSSGSSSSRRRFFDR